MFGYYTKRSAKIERWKKIQLKIFFKRKNTIIIIIDTQTSLGF